MKVLILEDEPLLAFDLKHRIECHDGAFAVCAASVNDALRQLEDPVDLVLLDINVRDGSTFDFARELRNRKIPFVFTSGSLQPNLPEDLWEEKYIPKPCDYKHLSQIIRQVMMDEQSLPDLGA